MVRVGSYVDCVDNTGILKLKCICIEGNKKEGEPGDKIVCVVKAVDEKHKLTGDRKIFKCVILGRRKLVNRRDGSSLKFNKNVVVMLGSRDEPMGSRAKSAVFRELRSRGYFRIVSMGMKLV